MAIVLATCFLATFPSSAATAPVFSTSLGPSLPPHPVLDLVGNRPDRNSAGHGRNVALYTGSPSKFFFATHNLGNVFSAVDGETVVWFPDRLIASPAAAGSLVLEQRHVCVTKDDVVVCDIFLTNTSPNPVRHRIEIKGDCRKSADWREKPGGQKQTIARGDFIVLRDENVFPGSLKKGLAMVAGSITRPQQVITNEPGAYFVLYEVTVPGAGTANMRVACAFDGDENRATRNLRQVLRDKNPLRRNREEWAEFFDRGVPRFRCSDRKLEELYAFRWYLLRFSTAGGFGYLTHPVVLEGRQAYQTYCCYSAPFMAYDLNWARDSQTGFGHIATMADAAYEDGRFPWYTSPRTNRVMVHHESRTGLSLLPDAAWKHYLVHRDRRQLHQLYPAMKKNMLWWIRDRDSNGDGIFQIAHQYETGMDDLHRWGSKSLTWRYDAVDATSYAVKNLKAVANMARVLGQTRDAEYFDAHALKASRALASLLWSETTKSWRDRHPETGQLADVLSITTLYPFFAGAARKEHLPVLREHLLNAEEFCLPFPVPALARNQRDFNPEGFWQGPSWPAATTHVLEGFAMAAKELDRTLLPEAGELFRRAAYVHLQPRADFYERYNPLTGKPLSKFRDYMHSWWIDLFVRHVAGLMIQDDGPLVIDALPIGLEYFSLEGVPFRGKKIDIIWYESKQPSKVGEAAGLSLRVNGRILLTAPEYRPGAKPIKISP